MITIEDIKSIAWEWVAHAKKEIEEEKDNPRIEYAVRLAKKMGWKIEEVYASMLVDERRRVGIVDGSDKFPYNKDILYFIGRYIEGGMDDQDANHLAGIAAELERWRQWR